MLTTKHGSSITCPDYGVPDVTHLLHDMTEAVALIQRGVKTSIQLYEPRLKNVQIRHVRNTNAAGMPAMTFEISGHIVLSDGRRQPLRMGTSMDEHVDSRAGGRSTVLGRRVCSTSTTRTS
jgi:type VI secretion system protein